MISKVRDGLPKIVIDGFSTETLTELRLDMDRYDYDDSLSPQLRSNVRATLVSAGGTRFEFQVEGKEQVGDTVYFYGPLRNLFPDLFKDIDPLAWQVAYLSALGKPSLDRFKVRRDDSIFDTDDAEMFRRGYEAGVNARGGNKDLTINKAAESLKGLSTAAKDAGKPLGMLAQAFNNKNGR